MNDFPPETPPHLIVRSDAMDVFIAWEKLRLLYNVILIALVLVYAFAFGKGQQLFFWSHVGLEAIFANVAFCAGPIAEGYLCWFGFERRSMRWWVFLAGLFFSVSWAIESLRKWTPFELGGGFLS